MNEALVELARQVRGSTLELLEATPASWLTWAPPGTSNHIVWHAGHALWLQDALFVQRVVGRSELPPGWADAFGQHCRPVRQTKSWPSRDEVATRLRDQLVRVTQLIQGMDTVRTETVDPWSVGAWNDIAAMIHAWHDEARHQGEMYLLLKLRRAAEQ